MANIVTAQQLIAEPRNLQPHVVLLGAGASKATFMDGDRNGRPIPVMEDLIEITGLRTVLDKARIDLTKESNFEVIYSNLAQNPELQSTAREIENQIDAYFSSLALPETATIYDRLLLSLRPADAVFTFNWDPFLFDAYQRNRSVASLPGMYFLHGNVRVGICCNHSDRWGEKYLACPDCAEPLVPVPLLFPLSQKNYSHPYIRQSWESARKLLRSAFTITIFGYGAPTADQDAVALLRKAWFSESDRKIEHVQIIDTACATTLHQRWATFTPSGHYRIARNFSESRIARWPRRTCESLIYPMTEGRPCEDFPLPETERLEFLQKEAARIATFE